MKTAHIHTTVDLAATRTVLCPACHGSRPSCTVCAGSGRLAAAAARSSAQAIVNGLCEFADAVAAETARAVDDRCAAA